MKKYKSKFKAKEYYLLNIYPQKMLAITGGILWRSYLGLLLGVILQYIFWFWHKGSVFEYLFLYWGWSIPWGTYWSKFVNSEVGEKHIEAIRDSRRKYEEDKKIPRIYIFRDGNSYLSHQAGNVVLELVMASGRLWGPFFLAAWFSPFRGLQGLWHKMQEYIEVTRTMQKRMREINRGNF